MHVKEEGQDGIWWAALDDLRWHVHKPIRKSYVIKLAFSHLSGGVC